MLNRGFQLGLILFVFFSSPPEKVKYFLQNILIPSDSRIIIPSPSIVPKSGRTRNRSPVGAYAPLLGSGAIQRVAPVGTISLTIRRAFPRAAIGAGGGQELSKLQKLRRNKHLHYQLQEQNPILKKKSPQQNHNHEQQI